MMGLYSNGYGYAHMGGGNSFLCSLLMIVVLIDLVLLGMWLWKRIKREDMKLCGSHKMKGMCDAGADHCGHCGTCGNKPCLCEAKG